MELLVQFATHIDTHRLTRSDLRTCIQTHDENSKDDNPYRKAAAIFTPPPLI